MSTNTKLLINTTPTIKYNYLTDARTIAFKFTKNNTLQNKVTQSLKHVKDFIFYTKQLMREITINWNQLLEKFPQELFIKRCLKLKEVLIKGCVAFLRFLTDFKELLLRYIALENGNYFITTFYEKFSSYLLIMDSKIDLLIFKIDGYNTVTLKYNIMNTKKLNKTNIKLNKVVTSPIMNDVKVNISKNFSFEHIALN